MKIRWWRWRRSRAGYAPPPVEVTGHFGANLMRFLLSQHYMCHAALPLVILKKCYRT